MSNIKTANRTNRNEIANSTANRSAMRTVNVDRGARRAYRRDTVLGAVAVFVAATALSAVGLAALDGFSMSTAQAADMPRRDFVHDHRAHFIGVENDIETVTYDLDDYYENYYYFSKTSVEEG